ncbi:ATP-binding cassette domain-containing protein [Azospirillum sp. ST 5-10]|uniref:ATP-binding cassette domain-containing protein n=1 Tax=unclassified Azospirillum TaxID=2630922 RepID=UPI003F49BE74
MTTGPLFALEDAEVRIGARTVLHPLRLELAAGRVYGLIGPNGSGKSTLLKLLARQLPADGGRVRFLGRPVDGYAGRDFARRVAYMPQFTPPTDGMTVRELVALGRFPWHGALGRFADADRAAVAEAIARTGLGPLAGRMVDSLSGGERQRAWLAMMLAQDGDCLLLDEPTSALDIAHQVEVLSLVRDLSRRHGLSVLVILHDVNMAARYCDAILALRCGRLAAHGTPAEIMRPETLKRIYGLDMGVLRSPQGGHAVSFAL